MENKFLIGFCWLFICFAFFYLGYMFGKLKNKDELKEKIFKKAVKKHKDYLIKNSEKEGFVLK